MALDGIKSILDLASDILEERDEKKQEKILSALDLASSEYLKRHGKPAYEKIKNDILGFPDFNLDEQTANRMVNHIANGHLSFIRELLWADLVNQGIQRDKAYRVAAGTFAGLLVTFFFIQAAGPESGIDQYGEVPQAIINWVTQVVAVDQKQRLVCPYCYRVIRQQDPKRGGIQDMGPSRIKCKECGEIIPTNLVPWNKRSSAFKIFHLGTPLIIMICTIVGAIAYSFGDLTCISISSIIVIGCAIWAFNSWNESKESLSTPTW